ncbi:MAG: PilT/PilU family type 4a pilus ATPase [Gammaproteobacteria bacterium]|nr:PilT/PilU family type 4a pilus ATPase [Gammaproteobacteria bacterium]MDH5801745.1 PilT/PilU family type 4a pilus ATPase [Gammaproteobacteria bacterium]
MEMPEYLKLMVKYDASDLFFTTGAPVSAKIQGFLKPLEKASLPAGRVKELAYELMNDEQIAEFEESPEMNLAHSQTGVGRFRVNIFQQRNQTAMVIRNIKTEIPTAEQLQLPPILKKIIMQKRGLILFVGGTGSGKSTSLASLIDFRNANSTGHIITIEDPIEFIHHHKKSIVNQREVGVDTDSYEDALKNTLRQAPDVILIGEIRDRETMEHAISFAETGHLAISTLHANNANQALDRIINFFPEDRRNQLLMDLSLNLRAFISQRLIPTLDGKRCVAVEVLLGTPLVCDLVIKGQIHKIKEVMEKSVNIGMQTFDGALFELFKQGKISQDEALRNADSQNNLRLKISLSEGKSADDAGTSFSLSEDAEADNSMNFSLSPK